MSSQLQHHTLHIDSTQTDVRGKCEVTSYHRYRYQKLAFRHHHPCFPSIHRFSYQKLRQTYSPLIVQITEVKLVDGGAAVSDQRRQQYQ
jgi:hypothetical protein